VVVPAQAQGEFAVNGGVQVAVQHVIASRTHLHTQHPTRGHISDMLCAPVEHE
jgi:hypothetical protein